MSEEFKAEKHLAIIYFRGTGSADMAFQYKKPFASENHSWIPNVSI